METYLAKFVPIVEPMGIEITHIKMLGNQLLEVRIAYKDFSSMDLDTVETVAQKLDEAIDFDVSLDVSSSGAEREIDPEDYARVVGRYVRIRFVNPIQGADYVEGEVLEVSETHIKVSYRVLQAAKTIEIERLNIKKLQLAVKV